MPLSSITRAFIDTLRSSELTAQTLSELAEVSETTLSHMSTGKKVGNVKTINSLLAAMPPLDQMRFVVHLMSAQMAENLRWLVQVLDDADLEILQAEIDQRQNHSSISVAGTTVIEPQPLTTQSLLGLELTNEEASLLLQRIAAGLLHKQFSFGALPGQTANSFALVDASRQVETEGILALRPGGKIAYVNATLGELWQLPKTVLQRVKSDDRLIPHLLDRVQDRAAFLAAVQSDVDDPSQSRHHLIALKDGRTLERRSQAQQVRDQTVGRMVVYRDVTDVEAIAKALRDSEQQFRALFDQNAIAMNLVSLSGQYVRANQSFCDLVGYDQIDLLQMQVQDLSMSEDWAEEKRQFEELRRGKISTYTIEKRCRNRDEQIVWVRAYSSLVRDEAGKPLCIVMTLQDLTEQKAIAQQREQAERDLHQSEARYRAIVQDQSELIVRFLPDTTITFANQAYATYQGMSRDRLLGVKWITLLESDEQQSAKHWLSQLSAERPSCQNTEKIRINRRVLWTEWTNTAVAFDSEGNVTEFQSVGKDITDIKNSKDQLVEREQWLNSIMQNTPGAIYRGEHSLAWRDLFISSAIEEISGYPHNEFTPFGERTYGSLVHPDDKDWVYAAEHQATVEEKKPFELEYRILHKDGTVRWVQERGRGNYDADGNLNTIDGIILDITDRKQAQTDLAWLTALIPAIVYRCNNDPDWTMYFISEGVEDLTGYSADDFRITKKSFRECIHPDDQEVVAQAGLDNAPTYEYSVTYRLVHRNGTVQSVVEHAKAIVNNQGEIIEWSGVITRSVPSPATESQRLG